MTCLRKFPLSLKRRSHTSHLKSLTFSAFSSLTLWLFIILSLSHILPKLVSIAVLIKSDKLKTLSAPFCASFMLKIVPFDLFIDADGRLSVLRIFFGFGRPFFFCFGVSPLNFVFFVTGAPVNGNK